MFGCIQTKVKPYELFDRELDEYKDKKASMKVMLEDGLEDVENLMDPEKERLKDAMKLADVTSDNIGTNYLKGINSVSFSDLSIYTVELPVLEHGRPEVKEAKMAEVDNLLDYDVFEEVEDKGQETIGSRWVVTAKEKHYGQKQNTKARLVACEFQETLKPQSDSLTVSKESFKMLMAVAANNNFKLALVDIIATFLQSRTLDRNIFMLPPPDIRKQGLIWRIKKPLYSLDDASRKFWLQVKEVLKEICLKVMEGDEAFYYLHRDGELMGAVITHVDDFTLAGTEDFIKEVLEIVS